MPRRKHVRIDPNKPRAKKGTPKREPVAYAALVPLVVTVAAWLGFDLDGETAAAIIAAVVIVAGIVRQYVTPVADPVVPASDDVAANPEAGESTVAIAALIVGLVALLLHFVRL